RPRRAARSCRARTPPGSAPRARRRSRAAGTEGCSLRGRDSSPDQPMSAKGAKNKAPGACQQRRHRGVPQNTSIWRMTKPEYSPDAVGELLSVPRLYPYLRRSDGDVARALALYEWSARMSAAAFETVAHLEVLLRNAIDA